MKGLFISGTNTDIGKTISSAILLTYLNKILADVQYIKPIQTNIEQDSDTKKIRELTGIKASQILGFKGPYSPHISAHLDNTNIDFISLTKKTKEISQGYFNLVEGAGGLLVPINNSKFIIDLISALDLACVLVASSQLGTINHTLLSLEALRSRGIKVFGVILVGSKTLANETSIKNYGQIKNLLYLPKISVVNKENIAQLVLEKDAELKDFFSNLRVRHDD